MRKYFSIGALALLSVLCFSVMLTSCGDDDKKKEKELSSSIVGTWLWTPLPEEEECSFYLTLDSNGEGFQLRDCGDGRQENKSFFTWTLEDGMFSFIWDDDVEVFSAEIKNGKLYLSDPDDTFVYDRVK